MTQNNPSTLSKEESREIITRELSEILRHIKEFHIRFKCGNKIQVYIKPTRWLAFLFLFDSNKGKTKYLNMINDHLITQTKGQWKFDIIFHLHTLETL